MRCFHRFLIPPPNGPISVGVCTLCGEMRDMFNSTEADSKVSWGTITKAQADAAKRMKGTLQI